MSRSFLVVEDDTDIAHLLDVNLRELCGRIDIAGDGVQGLARAMAYAYDLIILDLRLPHMDGLELCRRLREQSNYTPILMLTAKSSELDRVLGLELGADDYLTKPFSLLELAARVKAILRRTEQARSPAGLISAQRLRNGELTLDLDTREVTLAGQAVALTAREFDLLAHFAAHPGRVYTRAQLLDAVWGHAHDGYEHTVNSHINRLRAKIERNPAKPDYVRTVWGVGYKFAGGADA
jgi:DNA-binding response OmpR family regulator